MLRAGFKFSLPATSELLAPCSSPFTHHLMGELKSPKHSHLMIFMRALLTDGVRGCQVKALHRELVTTCPCMSLIEIHDSETHLITTLDTANEIHDPIMRFTTCLTRVATHKVLEKCLGLDSSLACLLLLNFWPHVPAPLPTLAL